ncbi:MAG: cation:proton antiporter family protein [Balneolaceae bacterium]|nr:cation:proton antiporter family protein [Balneolaceae bacterium]
MDILWVGVAFLAGMLVSKIKLPPLVGYLAAGGILAWGGYEGGELLHEISHLGVLFLLFTVGLHLRFKNIIRPEVLGAGSLHLLITTAIFLPVCFLFGYSAIPAVIIALVLGFSSTVLAAKNLERRKELGAYHGRVAIGILILQDLVAIVLLALTGGSAPSPWSLALLGIPLLRPAAIKLVELSGEEELKLLFGLMLAIGGGSLFGALGLSSELGALVAGMLLSGHRQADELSQKLWALKEAFLVGFFLEVGLSGLPSLNDFYLVLAGLLILPLKAALFYGFFLVFKLRARTSFLATISLTSYSEFMLIAGSVAASAGLIPNGVIVGFALLVAISFALNAPLSIWEEQIWAGMESFLSRFQRDVKHPDQLSPSLGAAEYLVVGMGNAGRAAYDRLKSENKQVVGMDIDPARIEDNLKAGRRVVYGDMQDTELWRDMDLSSIRAVMIVLGTPEAKVNATRQMRERGFKGNIYALTMREDEFADLKDAGASAVCIPITQAGRQLAELSLTGTTESSTLSLDPGSV